MPWTPQSFAAKHHHGLRGKRARHAAHVADSVLARTGDEGLAIRKANGVVKSRAVNRRRKWRPN